jgi:hypothetical protein
VRLRRIMFGAAALALGTGSLVVGLASSASASVRNIPTVTANGTAACGKASTGTNGISGTITFTPPLKNGGTASEVTSVKIKEKDCTTTATNLAHGGTLKGKVKQSISSPTSTNSCTGLTTSAPETLTVKWTWENSHAVKLDNVTNTVISFSGYNIVSSTNPPWTVSGDEGFQLPGNGSGGGGTSSGTGSFLGTDGGASSTAVAYLGLTAAQLATDCASTGGLASATFAFGAATVG